MTRPGQPTMPSVTDHATTQVEEAYCSACNQSFSSDTKICPNDGARLIKLAAQRDDLLGKVLDERYEIRAPLGKGGMGTVYRGWQLSVDREVAIKVIHPKLSDDRSAVKRFLREARLASRLSQPNIVNVYDFGQHDGVLYLVMELLRGHTLSSELGHGRRLNTKRTVGIAAQLCDALEAAHAQGIVHRDLKPGNIVILDDPPGRDLIKVLDFGLAKSLLQDSGSLVTNTDALLGTPLYMAPEQIQGDVSDQRADLYSLGCILFEMLTGRPPFVDAAVSAVLARHVADAPPPLPSHVPFKLRTLVEGLLAKTPEERVQTAGEVRRVLDDLRDTPGLLNATPQPFDTLNSPSDTIPDVSVGLAETHAASTPVPAGMVVAVPPASLSEASPVASRSPLRRWGLLGVALVAAAAAGGLALTRGGGSRTATTAPPSGPVEPAHVPAVSVDAAAAAVTVMDAGVDAAATPDASVPDRKKPGSGRPRPVSPDAGTPSTSPTTTPPRPAPDAGMPDLDFVRPK